MRKADKELAQEGAAAQPEQPKPKAKRAAKAKVEAKGQPAAAEVKEKRAKEKPAPAEAKAARPEAKEKPAQGEAKPKAAKGEAKAEAREGKAKAERPAPEPEEKIPPRLKERYRAEIMPALMKQFNYRSVMQVPRVTKVVVNMGVGAATQDAKVMEGATKDMALITGQRPAITRAKRSIAQFRLRQGMAVGCRVTLRGDRMYEFMDRLFNVALPRIRDFRGLPARSVDGRGNYTLGIREQLIFPEIDVEQTDRVRGMNVTIATSARTDEEARALLMMLGLPMREA